MKSNKTILCDCNLFALNQSIYLLDYDNAESPVSLLGTTKLEDVGTVIAQFCQQEGIHHVHLVGPSDNIFTKVIEDIDTHTNNAYSKKEIEIEVN